MERVIEVNSLFKSYGTVKAVAGIDFYVEKGRLFAFLGPNGAGKSTTIDIISTALSKDSGEVTVGGCRLGEEDDRIRAMIGVVFQDNLLDPLLTVYENLSVRGSFYGLKGEKLKKAVEYAAQQTGVTDFLHRRYGTLSGGQKRRADIGRALVNTPKILFLDEPTTGLDPQTRRNIWQTVRTLQKREQMTVFLTTHYMEEAAEADYVIIIDNGSIAAKGTPAILRQSHAHDVLMLYPKEKRNLAKKLAQDEIVFEDKSDRMLIKMTDTDRAIELLARYKEDLVGFERLHGTLEDAFIEITGKEIRS